MKVMIFFWRYQRSQVLTWGIWSMVVSWSVIYQSSNELLRPRGDGKESSEEMNALLCEARSSEMEQKGEICEEILRGLGNKLHMVEGTGFRSDSWVLYLSNRMEGGTIHWYSNHKGNSSFERKAIILIWSLLGLRFLLDILIGYVNLRHESDLGYQVRNPQRR